MNRKLIRIGNSYGVTLPREFIAQIEAEAGDIVEVGANPRQGRITLKFPAATAVGSDLVDEEVYKAAKSLLKRYLPAFKKLANV